MKKRTQWTMSVVSGLLLWLAGACVESDVGRQTGGKRLACGEDPDGDISFAEHGTGRYEKCA